MPKQKRDKQRRNRNNERRIRNKKENYQQRKETGSVPIHSPMRQAFVDAGIISE